MYRKTYVEINLDTLKQNVKEITNYYNDYKYYIGVLKADAYGYGSYIAKTLIQNGINFLATSSIEESLEVRKEVDTPILCLEPVNPKYIDICIANNISITLSNYDNYLKLKDKNIENLKIHLKIDTGMNRLGFQDKNQIKEVYENLKNNIEGIYTHFATTGINDKKYDNQVEKFLELTSLIDLNKIKMVHLGRSATMVNHKKLPFANGVRIGILMYGIKPTPIVYHGIKGTLRKIKRNYIAKKLQISETTQQCDLDIKPAFNLISEVIEIKSVKKGNSIGYGMSYKADKDINIAVIPVGYADGIDLRNTGRYILINNDKYKIVGSINSGMITVEVDNKVKINDKAIIIGNNIKEIANYIKTTPYVVTSSVNPNLPRVYVENNKIVKIVE